jgi:hypothetical protein
MKRFLLTALIFGGCLAASAAGSTPPDLNQSYLFTSAGHLTLLHAGTTYQASLFPISLRVGVPTPGWSGVQWKSGSDYFRGGGPPNYGWVHFARGSTSGIPQGLISIMTAYTRTPSVALTVNVLRTRGHSATYEPTSPVTLAGFSGIQFDGRITGAKNVDHTGHYFIPFSPASHAAKYYPDEYPVYGDVFRVLVLDVRGKTVVVYIENVALPPQQFPAFLTKAEQILHALRFPASAKGA